MTQVEFRQKYYPYAQQSSKLLDGALSPETILAYWSIETAWGTNRGAEELNNLAGIKYSKNAKNAVQSGMYAKYNTLSDFAIDYARVLKLSYYKDVLVAGKTPSLTDDIVAMNKSPYAEDDYPVNETLNRINVFRGLVGQPSVSIDNSLMQSAKEKLPTMQSSDIEQMAILGLVMVAVVGLIGKK